MVWRPEVVAVNVNIWFVLSVDEASRPSVFSVAEAASIMTPRNLSMPSGSWRRMTLVVGAVKHWYINVAPAIIEQFWNFYFSCTVLLYKNIFTYLFNSPPPLNTSDVKPMVPWPSAVFSVDGIRPTAKCVACPSCGTTFMHVGDNSLHCYCSVRRTFVRVSSTPVGKRA